MASYYNEFDAEKAEWLRELIRRGVVAHGDVDTRNIKEVEPKDLAGYAQCHFFAGIGVWSYALRLAGWPDDRSVWTDSCPCPSFSAAGKGGGFNDPRHLWPDWARLVRECKPATLFGEQADDAIGYGWLDLVQTDLERENYAVGKAVLGACSVGAPHIRQRLYFVAHAEIAEEIARSGEVHARAGTHDTDRSGIGGDAGGMEHADSERCGEARRAGGGSGERGQRSSGGVADASDVRRPPGGNTEADNHSFPHDLSNIAEMASWPTQEARDFRNENMSEEFRNKHFSHPRGKALSQVATLTVSGETRIGYSARDGIVEIGNGAQLNPAHSRWLQGLPRVFCDCAVTAMQSFRKSQRRS